MIRLKFERSLCGLRLDQPGRSAFTLKELLACIAAFGALLAISLPAIQSARETQRQIHCISNLKEIGMALLNYEYGWRSLPPISSNIDSIADVPGDASATTNNTNRSPGSADSPGAGYSWMVQILPELEEGALYQSIVNKSKKLTLSAFDTGLQFGSSGRDLHCATLQLDAYICPSFAGGPLTRRPGSLERLVVQLNPEQFRRITLEALPQPMAPWELQSRTITLFSARISMILGRQSVHIC